MLIERPSMVYAVAAIAHGVWKVRAAIGASASSFTNVLIGGRRTCESQRWNSLRYENRPGGRMSNVGHGDVIVLCLRVFSRQ